MTAIAVRNTVQWLYYQMGRWRKLVWILALVAYVALQAIYHLQVWQGRGFAPELDDILTYAWQAERLSSCRSHCTALDDLAPILRLPSDNIQIHNQRVRNKSRLLVVYAPLQEGVLLLYQRFSGLEYQQAYIFLIALSVVLQSFGIGMLLSSLWGEWAASLGLITVAMTIFPASGFHLVTPSNITLAMAMIVWAIIIRKGRAAVLALLLGCFLLSLSHTIGRLYAFLTIGLYLLSEPRLPNHREWVNVVLASGWVLAYWIFARFSSDPPIDVDLNYINPEFPTYGSLAVYQVRYAFESVLQMFDKLSFLPVWLDILIVLGAFLLLRQRYAGLVFFGLSLGITLAMTLTSLPVYPGEGVARVALIVEISIAIGAWGAVLAWSVQRLVDVVICPWNKRTLLLACFALVIGLILGRAWARSLARGFYTRNDYASIQIQRQAYDLRHEALSHLQSQEKATVLYTDEIALLYGLSKGLHRFNAVYPPILEGSPEPEQVDYIVGVKRGDLDPLKLLLPDPGWQNYILLEPTIGHLRLYARRDLHPHSSNSN